MKNKYILGYGIVAFIVLASAVLWFTLSVSAEAGRGTIEAEQSFSWISRETASAALSDGFMTDSFVQKVTALCQKSRLLSAVVISTPSGAVFAWPQQSRSIQYDIYGKPQITGTSNFMKVYSSNLDIGDASSGSVVITAVLFVLPPDAIFSASRNSFLVILTLLLVTFIVILVETPGRKKTAASAGPIGSSSPEILFDKNSTEDADLQYVPAPLEEPIDDSAITYSDYLPDESETIESMEADNQDISTIPAETVSEQTSEPAADTLAEPVIRNIPEGLFSPVTGIGWEQYLQDRLDAELIRAASSEQDLSLMIIRINGLLHTDLLSRKIALVLLDTFKFRDLVFEYGTDGFSGILQNINLDQAMKIADTLYAGIDSILMELAYEGKITIGITTRTARLLPASRMIEEAASAARKAVEEANLPIVAFRANPEKYRNYVAENN